MISYYNFYCNAATLQRCNTLTHCCMMFSTLKSDEVFSAFSDMSAHSVVDDIRCRARDMSSMSPHLKNVPQWRPSSSSFATGKSDDAMGNPWAIASTRTSPKPSHLELSTYTLAPE